MFIKCKGFTEGRIETDLTGFIRLLKESGILNKKGEPKEAIKVYLGGAFFKGIKVGPDMSSYPWTFSTFDLDRDEERIDVKGWELSNYLKNPVILWSHDSRIPAIGYTEKVRVNDGSLGGNIIFNKKDVDPFGWGIGQRVASGVIRAGSVGFMVNKVELSEKDGQESLIFRNQELLEFSVCNVPSNPFALVQDLQLTKKPGMTLEEEEIVLNNVSMSLSGDESEEQVKGFWKGLIKSMDGGV